MTGNRQQIDSVRGLVRRVVGSPRATGAVAGVLGGASVIVPMRRWPRPLLAGALLGVPPLVGAATTSMLRSASADAGIRPSRRAVVVAAAGPAVVVFAAVRLSLLFDDAVEGGLRRLGVPAPRLVFALVCGAATGFQPAADLRRGRPWPAPGRTPAQVWA